MITEQDYKCTCANNVFNAGFPPLVNTQNRLLSSEWSHKCHKSSTKFNSHSLDWGTALSLPTRDLLLDVLIGFLDGLVRRSVGLKQGCKDGDSYTLFLSSVKDIILETSNDDVPAPDALKGLANPQPALRIVGGGSVDTHGDRERVLESVLGLTKVGRHCLDGTLEVVVGLSLVMEEGVQ